MNEFAIEVAPAGPVQPVQCPVTLKKESVYMSEPGSNDSEDDDSVSPAKGSKSSESKDGEDDDSVSPAKGSKSSESKDGTLSPTKGLWQPPGAPELTAVPAPEILHEPDTSGGSLVRCNAQSLKDTGAKPENNKRKVYMAAEITLCGGESLPSVQAMKKAMKKTLGVSNPGKRID